MQAQTCKYICKYSHIFNAQYSYFNLLPVALRIMHVEQIKPEEDSLSFSPFLPFSVIHLAGVGESGVS